MSFVCRDTSENHDETGQKRAPFSGHLPAPVKPNFSSAEERARVATGSRLIGASSKYSPGCSFVLR